MIKRLRYNSPAAFGLLLIIWCVSFVLHQKLFIYKSEINLEPGHSKVLNYKNSWRKRNIASYNEEDISSVASWFEDDVFSSETRKRLILNSNNRDSVDYDETRIKEESNVTKSDKQITLNDIYISVKTTGKYHRSRLQVILDTWFRQAKNQTYFFTDVDSQEFSEKTGGHLINTGCKDSHTRHDLSCKLGAEYDGYLNSNKKWWCHFDDDNYVNVNQLVVLLRQYSWNEDFYLGKPSLGHPFRVTYEKKKHEFWFATGGAGVCVSRSLAIKMKPWCWNGGLLRTSEALNIPDDCTLGFVIVNKLGIDLTRSDLLHSHLETLADLNRANIPLQVSLSYKFGDKVGKDNLIPIPVTSTSQSIKDPTRFYSLHCLLYPTTGYCR